MAQKAFKDEGDGFIDLRPGLQLDSGSTLVSLAIAVSDVRVCEFCRHQCHGLFYEEAGDQMRERGQPDDQIATAEEWTRKLFWAFFGFGFIFALLVPLISPSSRRRKISTFSNW